MSLTRHIGVRRLSGAIIILPSYFSQCVLVGRIAEALGSPPVIAELRKRCQRLAPEVFEHIRDSTTRAFLVRARDPQASDVQWLESLGATLTNQAPRFWMDHHYEEFVDKLSLVALTLTDARRRAYARSGNSGNIRRIVLEVPGQEPLETILTQEELQGELGQISKAVVNYLDLSSPDLSPDYKRRILAGALELMARDVATKGGNSDDE